MAGIASPFAEAVFTQNAVYIRARLHLVDDEDDGVAAPTRYPDLDGDGWGDEAGAETVCEASAHHVEIAGDCDDADPAVSPSAIEVCDELDVDEDCSGEADDDDGDVDTSTRSTWFRDLDGDGAGDAADAVESCDAPDGYVDDDQDCDDSDPAVSPAATEVCDDLDVDEDCSGAADDDDPGVDASTQTLWSVDADGDGYGSDASTFSACEGMDGYSDAPGDCDDDDPAIHPGATEVCDDADVDEDCDGLADDGDDDTLEASKTSRYRDADGDGYGDPDVSVATCDTPWSYVDNDDDCDDGDPELNPDAVWYADRDGDGYGDAAATTASCLQPTGYVASDTDCDDTDADISPAGAEVCDADDADEDCDGLADDDDASATGQTDWYVDADSDGHGDEGATPVQYCDDPSAAEASYSSTDDDCDDDDGAISPSADEVCDDDDVDEDCDGLADDDDGDTLTGSMTDWYRDGDFDSYGAAGAAATQCEQPPSSSSYDWVLSGDDCDDTDADVNPDADEVCDDVDNDCDSSNDPDILVPSDHALVQDAVDAASAGDWVCVAAGTYVENVVVETDIHLEGQDRASTILDGGAAGSVLELVDLSSAATIEGFTLTNGYRSLGAGLLVDSSDAWLEDLEISGNDAYAGSSCGGAAVFVDGGSDVAFHDVQVSENTSDCGQSWGMFYVDSTDVVTVSNSTFAENEALVSAYGYAAGGVFVGGELYGTNVVIAGNTVSHSDGAATVYSVAFAATSKAMVDLENVAVVGNHGDAGTGSVQVVGMDVDATKATVINTDVSSNTMSSLNSSGCGGVTGLTSSHTWTYNNVYDNDGGEYCNDDPTGSDGNLSASPGYLDTSSSTALDWDLTLSSTSSLIDAGDPSVTDPDGSTSDIGAHGGPGADDW